MVKIFEAAFKDRQLEQAELAVTLEPKGNGWRKSKWTLQHWRVHLPA
ncbi:MAG: hypothetical protein R8K20_06945 [Gallionellaceae bacterium]